MPYITSIAISPVTICRQLIIPNDTYSIAAVNGALQELVEIYNWEQVTGVTPEAMSARMQEMLDEYTKDSACMIGTLVNYVTIAPPVGVLACDGSFHLRIDYPTLYAMLPPSLIVDADTFKTPIIQDQFILGAGATYLPETTGGEIDHQLTVGEMPNHNHLSNYPTFTLSIKTVGAPNIESGANPPLTPPTSNTGNDEPHNNMPPFIAYPTGLVAL